MFSRSCISLIYVCLLLSATTAYAQTEQVMLRVDGLACPFCAYGLEKKIKKLDGFRSLDIKINEGKVFVDWRRDQPLDLDTIQQAVKKAGFTLRSVRGRFVGLLIKNEQQYELIVQGPFDQRMRLLKPSQDQNENHQSRSGERESSPGQARNLEFLNQEEGRTNRFWQRLDALADEGKPVRIIGLVHSHEDPIVGLTLSVETLESASPPINFGAELVGQVKLLNCERCVERVTRELIQSKDVLYVEADHRTGLVHVWTKSKSPDIDDLRRRIKSLGFEIGQLSLGSLELNRVAKEGSK